MSFIKIKISFTKYLIIVFFFFYTNHLYSQSKIEINGFVKDSKTNEDISEAVILTGGKETTLSDSSGFFSILLKPGRYDIECKRLGYISFHKQITLAENDEKQKLFFYLTPSPIEINKVTVSGFKYKELEEFKTYELQAGDISNIPIFLESDPLRAVQALPGVTSLHDLSALIYLRGGNFDETLISLDNVPVYNSYHLGGIFGAFNSDIVEREILYPSNYPVSYQGVLSGILDIKSKNGNKQKLKGIGTISLASSKIFLEGPLLKGSFIFSARRTYPDLLYNLLSKDSFPYSFYDFFGKYTIPIDEKNLFSFSAFYSKDIYRLFEEEDDIILNKKKDLGWGNKIAKLSYSKFFNDENMLKLEIFYSNSFFNSDAKGISNKSTYFSVEDSLKAVEHIFVKNKINDLSFNSSLELNFTGQEIKLGLEYKYLSTGYNWNIKEHVLSNLIDGNFKDIFFDFAPPVYNNNDKSRIISAYFSDKLQILPSMNLTPGYRAVYVKKINKLLNSPYLSINYCFNDKINLTASYGKYYEYFFSHRELTNQAYFSPFAAYFFANYQSSIPSSEHFSLGLKIENFFPSFKFETEIYYKKRNNIFTSDELTQTSSYTNGYAAGLDFLLKKETGNITGWISYSFSRSIKNGKDYKYFASYDRTHILKILANYYLSETWEINAFWLYSTGLPLTPVIGKYVSGFYNGFFGRTINTAYGKKNSQRYENYNRLDVGITGHFIWGNILLKPYLQIMNIYMSKNPFNYKPTSNDTSIEEGTERGSNIIPTIGLTIEF